MASAASIIKESAIQFGTSGARSLVEQFSTVACAAFTASFVEVMKSGFEFNKVLVGIDLRPSSPQMASACIETIKQLGLEPEYLGVLPTPALAYRSLQLKVPAIMITGSHIPFDRNGIKFYRPDGEISKADEQAILASEAEVPGVGGSTLPKVNKQAFTDYQARYSALLSSDFLTNKRVGIYEHSSAGRDLYVDLFTNLGAEVISLGRSDKFVPIDTEAVRKEDIEQGKLWAKQHQLDFLFSTDGDGDRPLIADENGQWLRGDIVGLLTAQYLNIEALAVPVSCNTAIEKSGSFSKVMRTRIGSPYVIEGMEQLNTEYPSVAGFEANGGFLLGSDLMVNNKPVSALPTRDALLPVIATMAMSIAKDSPLSELIAALPKRYTASDRIQNFATEKSRTLIANWGSHPEQALQTLGLNHRVNSLDTTDGLRLTLDNGDVVHLRPSGNAPELRCYAESDKADKAESLVFNSLQAISKL